MWLVMMMMMPMMKHYAGLWFVYNSRVRLVYNTNKNIIFVYVSISVVNEWWWKTNIGKQADRKEKDRPTDSGIDRRHTEKWTMRLASKQSSECVHTTLRVNWMWWKAQPTTTVVERLGQLMRLLTNSPFFHSECD